MSMKNIDPQKYNEHFSQNVNDIRAGPVENQYRSCNDICCIVTFAVLMMATLVIGIIMLSDGSESFQNVQVVSGIGVVGLGFSKNAGVIIAMFFLSIIVSIVFIFFIRKFPKCMVYSMIVLIVLIFIAILIYGIIKQIWAMVIVAGIVLLTVGCIIFCCRNKLKTGIILLQAAGEFLTEKPSVYAAPSYPLIFGILFFVFWCFSFVAGAYSRNQKANLNQSTSKEDFFLAFFAIMYVFMNYFLYYIQTFLVATACAFWYYGINLNYFTTGIFRANRFHLGSMTFGALVIAIVSILRRIVAQEAAQQFGEGNCIVGCCLCLVQCCLSCIQGILEMLNHNAIIVMSVTGQSYINSAKSAVAIIFQNFTLFYIVDFIGNIVVFFGMLLSIGIPTLVAFIIVNNTATGTSDEIQNQTAGVTIVVFFLSILISGVIISMISEALHCIFIFYCFDRKFLSMGINVSNSPLTIRNMHSYIDGYPGDPAGTGTELHNRKGY